jgi:hypothetical protein
MTTPPSLALCGGNPGLANFERLKLAADLVEMPVLGTRNEGVSGSSPLDAL